MSDNDNQIEHRQQAFDSNNDLQLREPDNIENIKNICKKYMNYHVIAQMKDGSKKEGIIEDMDDQSVTMLIPEDVDGDERQFYDYGPGYRPRFRRFRRFRFPYYLFLPPFFYPYPYYPYYPYYGPY